MEFGRGLKKRTNKTTKRKNINLLESAHIKLKNITRYFFIFLFDVFYRKNNMPLAF